MRTSYIERMSVADRKIALRVYFDKLGKNYNDYVPGEDKKKRNVENDLYYPVSKHNISFSETLGQIFPSSKYADLVQARVANLVYTEEELDALKFKYAKNINLIESLLYKLCHDTIDSSIITEDSTIDEVKRAVVWQYVDCVSEKQATYQDIERIKIIYGKFKGVAMPNLEEGLAERATTLKMYKESMRKMLCDTFDVLENLVNFNKYLTVVEDYSTYSDTKNDNLSFMQTYPQMECILALAETVKKLVLDYLVSYVKIKQLNLPHSFLKDAQFSHSILFDSNLMSSELTNANFSYSTMRNCDLSMCELSKIKAEGADFTGATLNYTNLCGANFSNAVINDVSLNSALFFTKKFAEKKGDHDISAFDWYNNLVRHLGRKSNSVYTADNKHNPNTDDQQSGYMKDLTWYRSGNICEAFKGINDKISEMIERNERKYNNRLYSLEELPRGACDIANLRNASIKRSALPNSNLSYVDLTGASFDDTDLNESVFAYNKARAARFSNTNFSKCIAYRSDFSDSTFSNANAVNTEFFECVLPGTSFENALLIGSKFICSSAKKAFIDEIFVFDHKGDKGFKYLDTEFFRSEPVWCEIEDASSQGIIRTNSTGHCVDMQDCNMQHCIATDCIFLGANLDRSVFSFADMKKSLFSDCVIRWADLYRANLSYSLLMGCSFNHTALNEVIFTNGRVFACDFRKGNMSGINLISCRLDNTIFNDANISKANFSNSKFRNCQFIDTNFAEVDLSKTAFVNCKFCNCNLADNSTINKCEMSKCEATYDDDKEILAEIQNQL